MTTGQNIGWEKKEGNEGEWRGEWRKGEDRTERERKAERVQRRKLCLLTNITKQVQCWVIAYLLAKVTPVYL